MTTLVVYTIICDLRRETACLDTFVRTAEVVGMLEEDLAARAVVAGWRSETDEDTGERRDLCPVCASAEDERARAPIPFGRRLATVAPSTPPGQGA